MDFLATPCARPSRCDHEDNNIGYKEDLGILHAGHQSFLKIPRAITEQYRNITKMTVDNNHLTELPQPELLPFLEELDCSHNKLTHIPGYKLKHLTANHNLLQNYYHISSTVVELCVSENPNIRLLPAPLCKLLMADTCKIKSFDITNFPRLEILSLRENLLTKITGGDNGCMQELDVANNSLSHVPHFKNLSHLDISHNKFKEIPHCRNLEILFAHNNIITHLPITMTCIKQLNVSQNLIKDLPRYPSLNTLIMDHNLCERARLGDHVEFAELSHNRLTEFNPRNLRECNLSHNNLRILHPGANLDVLNISHNPLMINYHMIDNVSNLRMSWRQFYSVYSKLHQHRRIVFMKHHISGKDLERCGVPKEYSKEFAEFFNRENVSEYENIYPELASAIPSLGTVDQVRNMIQSCCSFSLTISPV